MNVRPILFRTSMVQALLAGRKTQTRRTIGRILKIGKATKFGVSDTRGFDWHFSDERRWHDLTHHELMVRCPYGQAGARGDLLWVRECFAYVGTTDPGWLLYRADDYEQQCREHGFDRPYPRLETVKWKPSIFMPRALSRLTLRITDVRVQRVQDITSDDVIAEGVGRPIGTPLRHGHVTERWNRERLFALLWESINGEGSWLDNPWVWALTFEVIRANVDDVLRREAGE